MLGSVGAGRRVVNVDALTYAGNLQTLASLRDNPLHVFVHGDICDRRLLEQVVSEHRPRAIVHFAAETHVDRSIDSAAPFVQTNVAGTLSLLEVARQYWTGLEGQDRESFRFLHVSTDEVYGSLPDGGQFTESSPYAPNSPYAASKAASDHLVRSFNRTHGLPTLTTHCSNNFGPYQFPEKLIPLTILKAVAGEPLPVYGDGSHVRDWLFVTDHCHAIDRILSDGRSGETYNVGGGSERRNLDLVMLVCRLLDERMPRLDGRKHETRIQLVADRPGHDRRYSIDFGKLRAELGWTPSMSLEDGLAMTVDWYLSNVEWVRRVRDGSYRGERLGIGK